MRWETSAKDPQGQVCEAVLGWVYLWFRVSPMAINKQWLAEMDNDDGWVRHAVCDNEQAAKQWCQEYGDRCAQQLMAAVKGVTDDADSTAYIQAGSTKSAT